MDNAATLAQFLASAHAEQQPEVDELTRALTEGGAEKAARKRALARALHPETPPRDEQGRFEGRAASFDGGARPRIPRTTSPQQAHDALVGRLAAMSRIAGAQSSGFFG